MDKELKIIKQGEALIDWLDKLNKTDYCHYDDQKYKQSIVDGKLPKLTKEK